MRVYIHTCQWYNQYCLICYRSKQMTNTIHNTKWQFITFELLLKATVFTLSALIITFCNITFVNILLKNSRFYILTLYRLMYVKQNFQDKNLNREKENCAAKFCKFQSFFPSSKKLCQFSIYGIGVSLYMTNLHDKQASKKMGGGAKGGVLTPSPHTCLHASVRNQYPWTLIWLKLENFNPLKTIWFCFNMHFP